MTRPPLVLLQTSDLRAGAPLVAPGVGWSAELREAVREARAGAAERAVKAARAADADAIVVPGDLWSADGAALAKLQRLVDALASFAPRPVVIAPGPLDDPARLPFADAAFRSALGLSAWPENVKLFAGGAWSAVRVREDALLVGRAWDGAPPQSPPSSPAAGLGVLVASLPAGEARVPNGWSWGAFGGRGAQEVREKKRLRGGFAGAPVPSSFEEGGEPAFLVVRLSPREEPQVTRVSSSPVRFLEVPLATDGLDDAALLERAARAMEEGGATARDAVRLTLRGTPAPSAHLHLAPLGARVLHLAVRDLTERPGEGESARSAEGRFAAELAARREGAGSGDEAELARRALEAGRAALAGRPIRPPAREEA